MAKGKDARFSPLQLFADDAGGSGGESGDGGDPGDDDGGKGAKRTYTDDDVDRIVERKLAEWQKKQEKAQQKQSAAQRLKEKSDQKTAEDRIQELQDQLAALQKKDAQSEMLKAARAILSEKNINAGDDLEDALDDNELIEIWEVNLEEEESDGSGTFKAKYFQGYLTEIGKTSSAEDMVEVSLTFGINGDGVDGYATVTDEQQEVAAYVFTDTQPTGA